MADKTEAALGPQAQHVYGIEGILIFLTQDVSGAVYASVGTSNTPFPLSPENDSDLIRALGFSLPGDEVSK